MTDEEVSALLLQLGSQRVAAWQRGEMPPPSDAPEGFEHDIREILWHVGAKPSAGALLAAGATPEQVTAALEAKKALFEIIEPTDCVKIPDDLASQINADIETALSKEPEESFRSLNEKVVRWITECRVEMYHNEGQHRGRPHVAVVLPDGKISVSLENPPIILTPNGYRGEASALKVVKKHLRRLRKLWDDSRPDDQKIVRRKKAAKVSKKQNGGGSAPA